MFKNLYLSLRRFLICCITICRRWIYPLKIHNTEETLRELVYTEKSISRLGDGEIDLIEGKNLKFQDNSADLSEKMRRVLKAEDIPENLMVAIPAVWCSYRGFTRKSVNWWAEYMYENHQRIYRLINPKYHYYDAQVTRIYINRSSKKKSAEYFELWKKVWENRDVLIVEGEATRMGVGSDLLSTAKSVRRILCPAKGAYSYYDEIVEAVKNQCKEKNYLVLALLGPTATVLAYDITKAGIRIIDTGNLDIEYEWLKMNATHQSKVAGKYTHEAAGGNTVDAVQDEKYLSEIIMRIGC